MSCRAKITSRLPGVRWSSRTISALSLISFLAVICIILFSNRYMDICVTRESQAQSNRTELAALGSTLADASDFLTDEVRKYAVTGDVQHLYNYWNEVYIDKRRDTAVSTLESYNPPEDEKALLAEAKRYSDVLIDTETCSMQLILRAQGKTASDYVYDPALDGYIRGVFDFDVPDKYLFLSARDMQDAARQMLFDSAYEQSKTLIMDPIERFQSTMNDRLAREAAEATAGREFASGIQIVCSLLSLLLTGLLLWALRRLYIRPMTEYSATLESADGDLTQARVTPSGAYEPRLFGQLFNRLSFTLQRELDTRRQAEADMRSARDEADKANNAKSDFLARMSHELRTPLGAVTGYLYLLEQTPLDSTQRRYCESMRISSESLLGLISDILDFSKIESGNLTFEKTDFDLVRLLDGVRRVLENEALRKGLYFRLDLRGDLPALVCGDPLRLRQVLMNLAGNAVKFTSEGGVTLSAEPCGDGGLAIRFSVRDTGIGISEKERKKIFEPFVQSDASVTRKYGGTGLGLAIARMTVETASGGKETLELSSAPGEGSDFHFRMHFGSAAAVGAASLPEDDDVPLAPGKTVLLVDDNDVNLGMEGEILQRFGLSVLAAHSGREALSNAAAQQCDLVLMDIRMPDMDGYEVASRLRATEGYRCVPILALTADVVAGVREKALASGMNDFATKPLKPHELHTLLKKYLDLAAHTPELLAPAGGILFRHGEALVRLGGNREKLAELCLRFVRAQQNSAEYVRLHLKRGNVMNARSILHDLIGLTGNLCCDSLCAASRTLLQQVHEGRADGLDAFLDLFTRTLAELKDYIAGNERAREKDAASAPFAQVSARFAALCADCDVAAAEVFETHRAAFRAHLPRDTYRRLEEAVRCYRFAQALSLLPKEKGEKL